MNHQNVLMRTSKGVDPLGYILTNSLTAQRYARIVNLITEEKVMRFDEINSNRRYITIPSSDAAPQVYITYYHYNFFTTNPLNQSQRGSGETASTLKMIKSAVSTVSAVRVALFVWRLLVDLFHWFMK